MTATIAGLTEVPPTKIRRAGPSRRRKQAAFRWVVVTVVMLFFAIPILSLLDFSSRLRGGGRDWSSWDPILKLAVSDDAASTAIRNGLVNSLFLVVATLVLMMLLLIPTMIWVRLRVPQLRRSMEFVCLLPLTIPAIVLVVGLGPVYRVVADVLGTGTVWLCFIYAILVLPFAYRSLDAGLDGIEVKTLFEAARSLGAGWATVMFRIVLPNIRSAVISACFISLALVLGEYTVASLLARKNLQTAIFIVGQDSARTAAALALVALSLGFVLLFLLSIFSGARKTDRKAPKGLLVTQPPPAAEGVSVELNALRRSFGAVHALDGMQLTMSPGEMVVLLGPSGCGKTTALRVLAGLEELDSGQVVVDGTDLTHTPTNKRDIGMVFQAYSLFPHMTARQNVEFGLRLRGVDTAARRQRAAENLNLVGLSAQADRYAHQMSGGQQQRVALARALAIRPQVLLLDEPLSALDAKVRVQLRDQIRRIQLEVGITTLFVTHDQEEALAVADRVGVMRDGRIEQIGRPSEIYNRPVSAFVAEFIGSTNRLAGQADGASVTTLGTRIPLLPGSATTGVVTVLVRPEAVRVVTDDTTDDGPGRATVVATSFLGAHGRLQARLRDDTLVIAQLAAGEAASLFPGQQVTLVVRATPALAVAVA